MAASDAEPNAVELDAVEPDALLDDWFAPDWLDEILRNSGVEEVAIAPVPSDEFQESEMTVRMDGERALDERDLDLVWNESGELMDDSRSAGEMTGGAIADDSDRESQ